MFRSIRSLIRPNIFRFATENAKQGEATKAVDKAKAKSEANRLTFYQNG